MFGLRLRPGGPREPNQQLLAQDAAVTPRLEELSPKVNAQEQVSFHPEERRANWTTKADELEFIRMREAIEREECPVCGKPTSYKLDGLACGWVCSACDWSMWTTRPDLDGSS